MSAFSPSAGLCVLCVPGSAFSVPLFLMWQMVWEDDPQTLILEFLSRHLTVGRTPWSQQLGHWGRAAVCSGLRGCTRGSGQRPWRTWASCPSGHSVAAGPWGLGFLTVPFSFEVVAGTRVSVSGVAPEPAMCAFPAWFKSHGRLRRQSFPPGSVGSEASGSAWGLGSFGD